MKIFKKTVFTLLASIFGLLNFSMLNVALAQSPYSEVISTTTDKIETVSADAVTDGQGADAFNQQVLNIINYVINIFIVAGIAVAFVGGYKIMTSSKEDATKDGVRLIVFGIIGVIIMVSAKFLAGTMILNIAGTWEGVSKPNGISFVSELYKKMILPFIKIAGYLVIGVLFIMMAIKVIGFIMSTDGAAKKKAGGVIVRTAVGILIIIGANQIVEAVMGKQEEVFNTAAQEVSAMGTETLEIGSIPLIHQIINRVMGLAMLVVLILVVLQGYRMFAKPDDPKNRDRLKKTLLYIVIGVLVIGAAYVVSEVLVVNRL